LCGIIGLMKNKSIHLCVFFAISALVVGLTSSHAHAQIKVSHAANADQWVGVGLDQDDQRRDRRPESQSNDRFARQNLRDYSESNQADEPRDSKLRIAVAIAESRGRVIRADPLGNGIFRVRVERDGRRVDMTIDANSGRILSER